VRDTRRRPFEITEYGIGLRRLRVAAMRGFTTTLPTVVGRAVEVRTSAQGCAIDGDDRLATTGLAAAGGGAGRVRGE
jgi:hypothetical protein